MSLHSHERRIVTNADYSRRGRELPPLLQEAHAKALKYSAANAPKPAQFVGVVDDQTIKADEAYVARLASTFNSTEDHDAKAAHIFEALICDEANQAGWFGRDGRALRTSAYDDFKNGVDLVAEFAPKKGPVSELALAVDVTFGTSGIEKKLERIRDSIATGISAEVRYYASPTTGAKRSLTHLPRAIVGVEYETLAEVARLWTQGKTAELRDHPVQRLIAEELKMQMAGYLKLARESKQSTPELVEAYRRAAALTLDLFNQKSHLRYKNGEDEDRVLQEIKKHTAFS